MWMITLKVKALFEDSPATVQESDVIVDARSWRDVVGILERLDVKHLYKIEIQHVKED